MAEAQCQGFISKPVMESELLEALARTLSLQWLHEPPRLALPPPSPTPAPVSVALPAELRPALRQMARLGHARGLSRQLARIAQADPALGADCRRLQHLVEHLDFAGLSHALKEDEHV